MSALSRIFSAGHRALATQQGGILSGVGITADHTSRFFVQATIILGITRSLSFIGTYLKQPKVIFEIIGGILLGPSALSRHNQFAELFPADSLDFLTLVSEIGLTLYLFLVGLELDPQLLKSHARSAGGIAIIGMAVPFALGVAISRVMFDVLQGDDPEYKDVDFVSFFVFIGTAMSITAFPVLARMLKEGGLIYTPSGAMAMGAAALNDALAWCLLTLAISIANAGDMATAGYIFLTVVGFASLLFAIVKPLLEALVEYVESMHRHDMNANLFVLTLCLVFMSAWTTALLGVHAIFGAFLFGLIVPRGSHLFKECNERMEELVVCLTLPLYFALSGLKTDVTTISSSEEGGITVLVCFAATIGKFIGAGGTALMNGMGYRESAVIAVLMNTRGLVELIVLNLGMSSGILSVRTFSVMVIMCLFTTFITSPLIDLIYPAEMRVRGGSSKSGSVADKSVSRDNTTECDQVQFPSKVGVDSYQRIAVVVDAVTKMQPLVNTVGYLVPQKAGVHLCVTALHFIEPTNSTRDEFLPLNSRGKLIRIDEESTDIEQALLHLSDPALKPPELLPMSVFCKAMHVPVNAFRIQGDPDEFPSELKSLYRQNDSEVVFMPFKPNSHYLQKFFWHAMHHTDVPTVLVMRKEAERTESGDAEEAPASSRTRAASFMHRDDQSPQSKPRSNSFFIHDTHSKMELGEHHEVLYTNLATEVLPHVRRGSVTGVIHKLPISDRRTQLVGAVFLGLMTDLVMMSLLLRIGLSAHNEITLLLPLDYDTFPLSNQEAYAQFIKATSDEGIKINTIALSSLSNDYSGICAEVVNLDMDLLMFSFVQPPAEMRNAPIRREGSTFGRLRAATMTAGHVEPLELRMQTGMPETCALSSLANPELGVLGSLVWDASHSKDFLVWVFHEAHKGRATHTTSLPGNTLATPVASSKHQSLSAKSMTQSNTTPPRAVAEETKGDNSDSSHNAVVDVEAVTLNSADRTEN